MNKPLTVLLMMPPEGPSPAERWVAKGIQAAGLDLILRLKELDFDHNVFVLAAEQEDRLSAEKLGAVAIPSSRESFHFGQALMDFISEKGLDRLAYFGSGSAPLITKEILERAFNNALVSSGPYAIVNNLHSTDWAVITHTESIQGIAERLPSDNQIGWVLKNEYGFEVEDLPISAAMRTDIDTPSDLLMIHGHPRMGPNLQTFYQKETIVGLDRIKAIQKVLLTPASHLTLIGRASSHLWRELESKTQIWIRMFVEERGMVASGRMGRGEVKSLIAEMVDRWSPKKFVSYLESISDAVLWDTRVWMAHHGGWPSKGDRFAADLGWVDSINDPSLKELTHAVKQASIPITTGGHGVVAGGLYALLETVLSG